MNTSQLKVLGLFLGHADGKLIKAAAFGEIMKPNVIASTTNCLLQGTQLPNIGIVVGFFSCNEWVYCFAKGGGDHSALSHSLFGAADMCFVVFECLSSSSLPRIN